MTEQEKPELTLTQILIVLKISLHSTQNKQIILEISHSGVAYFFFGL